MRRRASFRFASALVVMALLVSFQGCKGREGPGGPSKIPGALPLALDSMSADSLVAFASTLKFVGDITVGRRCDDDAGCAGDKPSQTARVTVSATDGAWVAGPGNLPANGLIMGRARNAGHREARYGLRPGAQFEYYVIVVPGASPSRAAWRIEEVSGAAGQRAHRVVSQGEYASCGHPPWSSAPPIPVGFYSCDNSPHPKQSSFGSITFGSITLGSLGLAVADPSLTDPMWFGCGSGCCSLMT